MSEYYAPKLQETVNFAWDNEHSDYYRELWSMSGVKEKPTIQTQDDFSDLPFSSRADLMQRLHPSERLFRPISEVEMLRTTSGTSGRGPLYFWRDKFISPRIYTQLKDGGGKLALALYAYHSAMSGVVPAREAGLELLIGDPHQLKETVDIAIAAGVDSLVVTPSVALMLVQFLRKDDYISKIVHIALWGEYCSDHTLNLVKESYPNASFSFTYALGEASDLLGYATDQCKNGNRYLHANTKDIYFEYIDNELVVTNLRVPHAMPLIRYKTGDSAKLVNQDCFCGDTNPMFEFLGRIGGDFVRIGGGEVRVEEIEKALSEFSPYIEPVFKVELRELEEGANRRVQLTLLLKSKDDSDTKSPLTSLIAQRLVTTLKLSPNMLLRDAIAGGIFSEPIVTFVYDDWGKYKNKTITFVSD
jgi:phenylacetate-coenzyme A ligase PaaK-like adenylate-forming protein